MELGIIFNALVVMGFMAAVFNYKLMGPVQLRPGHRLVFLFMLGCFIVTEAMIAWHQPIYWLYVLLNIWGVYNIWRIK